MPNYNVTFTSTFTSQVTANNPDEAANAIELIANDENDIDVTVINVEEILPEIQTTYVSLRDFHNSQLEQENQNGASSSYVRFVSTPSVTTTTYSPFFRS